MLPSIYENQRGVKMTIIEKLKAKSLQLRKEHSPVAASIAFALSEITKIGKNNGNRETTDDEAIKVIQKLLIVVNENIRYAEEKEDDGRLIHLHYEKNILESVLPKMASDQDITDFLRDLFTGKRGDNIPKKGDVMKALRDHFGALVDMKHASEIAKELYGV
jgi:uncharacterized protein YqeY